MADQLFAPQNLLETCQGLQEVIAYAPPDEKAAAGQAAKDMIEPDQLHYHGATKLEIRTLAAYALPDGLTTESHIWPVVRWGELRLRGDLAQVAFMRVDRISTLAWMVVDPLIRQDYGEQYVTTITDEGRLTEVTDADHVIAPAEVKLDRPLYLPVGMIESVLAAN